MSPVLEAASVLLGTSGSGAVPLVLNLGDIPAIVLNGLQQGAIFALLGMGLTIILGTMNFLNLAHGALYLVGAYVGLIVATEFQITNGELASFGIQTLGLDLGFFAALIVVPFVVFAVGLLMERFLARPFYDRPETDQLLVTFGIALVVQELIKTFIGSQSLRFGRPEWAAGPVQIPLVGGFSKWRLYLIVITFALIAVTYLIIERTDFGLVVRAGTEDSEMVRLLGIEITRSYLIVFALGAALAGIAGLVAGSLETVNPNIGVERALVPAFLTIVVGGAGSVVGAIVGGIVLGLTVSSLIVIAPAWSDIGLYVVAALVLLFKPEGLLGEGEFA